MATPSTTKSKVLTGRDFCKTFRVDGHQVVFVLLDDEIGVPVLHILCEIHGERVKSAFQPEFEGKPLLHPQQRHDFAISALNDTDRRKAVEMYSMIQRQWEASNGKKSAPIDASKVFQDETK